MFSQWILGEGAVSWQAILERLRVAAVSVRLTRGVGAEGDHRA
jgi:hypothetical protein